MRYETLSYEFSEGVARLTLARPDRLNAFNVQMHLELIHALDATESDGARVLVLSGAGRAFCAGQDLMERSEEGDKPFDLGASIEAYYNPLVRRLADFPAPTIAAVNGVAAGAGANVALACDIVIAARSARFIQSFAKIGLVPDCGGTWILPRLVGQARAAALAISGDAVSADTAEAWGMIWKAVDDAHFADEVEALAARLAAAPTQGVLAVRNAIRQAWRNDLNTQLDAERDLQRSLGLTDDYREGLRAFKAKRTPNFQGR